MHGYEFFLMATGYAKYIDGKIIGDNEDIACEEGTLCPFVTFDEQVLKEQRQARTSFIGKNAILVPPQGYAIVRFRWSIQILLLILLLQSVESRDLATPLPPGSALVRRNERAR